MSTYWAASEKFTASKADEQIDLQRTTEYSLPMTANMSSLTGTDADCPGCTVTFTVDTVGATYTVFSVWDYEPGSLFLGRIYVDGVVEPAEAHQGASGRITCAMNAHGTFTTAGSHTIKLMASVTGASGTLYANHTNLLVQIREAI